MSFQCNQYKNHWDSLHTLLFCLWNPVGIYPFTVYHNLDYLHFNCLMATYGWWLLYLDSAVQLSHSVASDSATPRTAASQASLSITNSQSLLKLMSIDSVMPSNHLILCHPLFHLTSIFLSISVFSNESVHCIRWSKYWNFSFSINPYN